MFPASPYPHASSEMEEMERTSFWILLLAAPLLAGCTPWLHTGSAIGIGAFWDVEESWQGPVCVERYSGVGLVYSDGGVFLGWQDVVRCEPDPSVVPSGTAQIDGMFLYWGETADVLAEQVSGNESTCIRR